MGLTWKQKQFCRLVASGTPQTVAYEQTYDRHGGKRRTRQVQANQLAHKPHVAAQIQAYEEQFAPIRGTVCADRGLPQSATGDVCEFVPARY
jgi:hypothetical protein